MHLQQLSCEYLHVAHALLGLCGLYPLEEFKVFNVPRGVFQVNDIKEYITHNFKKLWRVKCGLLKVSKPSMLQGMYSKSTIYKKIRHTTSKSCGG